MLTMVWNLKPEGAPKRALHVAGSCVEQELDMRMDARHGKL